MPRRPRRPPHPLDLAPLVHAIVAGWVGAGGSIAGLARAADVYATRICAWRAGSVPVTLAALDGLARAAGYRVTIGLEPREQVDPLRPVAVPGTGEP